MAYLSDTEREFTTPREYQLMVRSDSMLDPELLTLGRRQGVANTVANVVGTALTVAAVEYTTGGGVENRLPRLAINALLVSSAFVMMEQWKKNIAKFNPNLDLEKVQGRHGEIKR